mmetsp:Transcript_7392/g.18340  ORF Transcript_7392/g.18340 Transcript_7392/m.18340 type:complete len:80 (-) Transcript_7392:41-280(-)
MTVIFMHAIFMEIVVTEQLLMFCMVSLQPSFENWDMPSFTRDNFFVVLRESRNPPKHRITSYNHMIPPGITAGYNSLSF